MGAIDGEPHRQQPGCLLRQVRRAEIKMLMPVNNATTNGRGMG